MAGEVLNMNNLTINKNQCKLDVLCFKTATKPYTNRWVQPPKKTADKKIKGKYENRKPFN